LRPDQSTLPARGSPRAWRAIKRWMRHPARRAALTAVDQERPGSPRPPARRQLRPHFAACHARSPHQRGACARAGANAGGPVH
jgi:hypothetical protein